MSGKKFKDDLTSKLIGLIQDVKIIDNEVVNMTTGKNLRTSSPKNVYESLEANGAFNKMFAEYTPTKLMSLDETSLSRDEFYDELSKLFYNTVYKGFLAEIVSISLMTYAFPEYEVKKASDKLDVNNKVDFVMINKDDANDFYYIQVKAVSNKNVYSDEFNYVEDLSEQQLNKIKQEKSQNKDLDNRYLHIISFNTKIEGKGTEQRDYYLIDHKGKQTLLYNLIGLTLRDDDLIKNKDKIRNAIIKNEIEPTAPKEYVEDKSIKNRSEEEALMKIIEAQAEYIKIVQKKQSLS